MQHVLHHHHLERHADTCMIIRQTDIQLPVIYLYKRSENTITLTTLITNNNYLWLLHCTSHTHTSVTLGSSGTSILYKGTPTIDIFSPFKKSIHFHFKGYGFSLGLFCFVVSSTLLAQIITKATDQINSNQI